MPFKIKTQDEFKGPDDRYLPRWEVNNRISFQTDNDLPIMDGDTKDLSCAGLCMSSDVALSPGKNIHLTIYLSDEVSVHAQGRIVWVKDDSERHLSGVHFSNLTQKTQETILNYAFELNQSKIVDHFFEGWK